MKESIVYPASFRKLGKMVLLGAMIALPVVSGCDRIGRSTPEEYIQKARDFENKGDLRASIIELKNALQKSPDNAEARLLLGKIYIEVQQGQDAEKELLRAQKLGVAREDVLPLLVKAVLIQGDLDRMITESNQLSPSMPKADQASILGLRGQVFITKGQFDLAQAALDQALQVQPDSPPALIGMTALHGHRREYDLARQWVEKALKADPSSPDAWGALGDIELAQGRLAEAEEAYGSAIKHRATPYLEHAKRAQVRVQLKKFPAATDDINALQKVGLKNHPYVNYVSGLNHFGQKNYKEAATAFEASYDVAPAFLPNRIYLATTHLILGNTNQARKHAQQIFAEAPRSKTATNLLGSILVSQAEYGNAKDVLQKALNNSPNDPKTLGMLSTVAMLEGNTSKGLEYARKVAALEPDSKLAQDLLMVAKLIAGEPLGKPNNQAGTQPATPNDAYTHQLMLALAAFRDGRLKDALEQAKALHSRDPNKVDPLKLMAACYLAVGQWDQGKIELEKVLKLEPQEPSATRSLAKVEFLQGNYQRVKPLLQPLLKNRPGDTEAVLLLASTESRLGNPTSALEVLEQAMKSNPGDPSIRSGLAAEYLRMGRADKVLEVTRGLENDKLSKQPALLELRGKAQLLSGDSASAANTFEKWTKISPKSAPAHFQHANALANQGNVSRARKALEQSIKLDPRFLPARIGEVKMRVQARELDQAKKALAKLRHDFGDRAEVLSIEGWFALGTGNFDSAEQKLTDAHKKNPDAELILLISRAQWAQKKQDSALKTMRDWLKDHPNDVGVYLQLASTYLDMGKETEALAAYAEVNRVVPQYVPALNNLAWLNRDKAPKKALEYAQQAYQLAPRDPYVLDTLGMLTLKNGDANQALNLLRTAATGAPTDPQIQLHLGRALIQQKHASEAKKTLESLTQKHPDTPEGKEARILLDTLHSASR